MASSINGLVGIGGAAVRAQSIKPPSYLDLGIAAFFTIVPRGFCLLTRIFRKETSPTSSASEKSQQIFVNTVRRKASDVLSKLITKTAQEGDFQLALELCLSTQNCRSWFFCVAQEAIKSGQVVEMLGFSRDWPLAQRSSLCLTTCRALVKAGHLDIAAIVASMITDPSDVSLAINLIARSYADMKMFREALSYATILDSNSLDNTICSICRSMVDDGQVEGVVKLAEDNPRFRKGACYCLASDRVDLAIILANQMDFEWDTWSSIFETLIQNTLADLRSKSPNIFSLNTRAMELERDKVERNALNGVFREVIDQASGTDSKKQAELYKCARAAAEPYHIYLP
jgi:hypothetical protein